MSPGLQSRVVRKVALCPSIRLAHQELQRESVDLNVKSVRHIAYQCGEGLLQWRRVVEELSDLEAPDGPRSEQLATEIAYLTKHGEAGRLSYRRYR